MSECIHKEVVTFRTEAGEPVPLWACSKCKTRFEPIGPWMEREKSLQARIEALKAAIGNINTQKEIVMKYAKESDRLMAVGRMYQAIADAAALLQEPTND